AAFPIDDLTDVVFLEALFDLAEHAGKNGKLVGIFPLAQAADEMLANAVDLGANIGKAVDFLALERRQAENFMTRGKVDLGLGRPVLAPGFFGFERQLLVNFLFAPARIDKRN